LFDLRDKGLSAAVYTQTTDVEVEVNGLMTYDRSIVKIDPGIISRIHKGYLSPAIESAGNIFVDSVKVTLRNKSPEGEVRYTLDGSEPAASSPVYTKPIIVKNNCTIKTKTFWPDGNTSGTLERKFQKVKPVKSIPVTNASAGIQYSFYNGKQKGWNFIPDLTKLQPDESGVLPFIDFSKWSTGEFFVLKYEGYIKVPETTVYNFILSSDDGSNLYIDDSVVVSNDGLHGTQEKPGSIALEAGYHKIRLEYLQGSGESMLKLLYSSDNSMPVEISSEMLFHTK
jgi:hexosaminidase